MEDNMSKTESPSQGVDHDTTTVTLVEPEEMSHGDHLSLRSFKETDFQDLSEPSKSTTAVPAWYLKVDKDLEALYHIIKAGPISELTLEMLEEMEQEIKDLDVLLQFTTKNLGKGRKKAKAKVTLQEAAVEKKKKNKGKRFLQWLKSKMSCCSCVDVRW